MSRDCCTHSTHLTNKPELGVWFPDFKSVLGPKYLWKTELIYLLPMHWWERIGNMSRIIRLLSVFYSSPPSSLREICVLFMCWRGNQRTCKDRNTRRSPMSFEHGRGPWCIQTPAATANLAPHQIIPKSPSNLLYWPRSSKNHFPLNYRDYSKESLLPNTQASCCKIGILKYQ